MALRRATGSSDNPLIDGGIRAVIAGALTAVLTVLGRKSGLLNGDDIADLAPAIMAASFMLAGLWDRFAKPRLPAGSE